MQTNTKEDIYNALCDDIIKLKLKPGEIISENAIATRFSVSRTPVRAVFGILSQEKLIDIYPQKGSYISLIDYSYVEQIFYMRKVLEIAIIPHAINKITKSDLDYLKYNLMKQEAIVKSYLPIENFLEIDNQFHKLLFQVAGKEIIWEIIEQTKNNYYRYRMLDMYDHEELTILFDQHNKIYQYLLEKNINQLYLVLENHLSECSARLKDLKTKYNSYFK